MALAIKTFVGTRSSISEIDLPLVLAQKTPQHIEPSVVCPKVS